LAGLSWWLLNGKKGEASSITPRHDTVQIIQHDTVVISKTPVKLILPNGQQLDAFKGSIEDLLLAFIQDSAAAPGNDNWFDFNELNFTFNTADIIPGSRKELDNIIEILKAFPNVKIKLGGYTDRVGNTDANKKLSQERANAVFKSIKEAGLAAQLSGSEGYGSEFAKFPADAPETDRIKDRRISLSVREK
jgi:outer membrane protein OmpA-like peptidoglycan-associated protein